MTPYRRLFKPNTDEMPSSEWASCSHWTLLVTETGRPFPVTGTEHNKPLACERLVQIQCALFVKRRFSARIFRTSKRGSISQTRVRTRAGDKTTLSVDCTPCFSNHCFPGRCAQWGSIPVDGPQRLGHRLSAERPCCCGRSRRGR